jgi:hypothetical protein
MVFQRGGVGVEMCLRLQTRILDVVRRLDDVPVCLIKKARRDQGFPE